MNGDVFVFVIVRCCKLPVGRWTFLSLFVFVYLFLLPNTWKVEISFAFVAGYLAVELFFHFL